MHCWGLNVLGQVDVPEELRYGLDIDRVDVLEEEV